MRTCTRNIYVIRASGYPPDTVYASTPEEALVDFRNNCGRGELNARLDYIVCLGQIDLLKPAESLYDEYRVCYVAEGARIIPEAWR